MKYRTKEPFSNRIAEIRRRNRISADALAILLGKKSVARILDYERGTKTPDLKTALKLAHIFRLPLRVILDGYYNACRSEIQKEEVRGAASSLGSNATAVKFPPIDFCTYEANLSAERMDQKQVEKARRHAIGLIRSTAEMLGHL